MADTVYFSEQSCSCSYIMLCALKISTCNDRGERVSFESSILCIWREFIFLLLNQNKVFFHVMFHVSGVYLSRCDSLSDIELVSNSPQ